MADVQFDWYPEVIKAYILQLPGQKVIGHAHVMRSVNPNGRKLLKSC